VSFYTGEGDVYAGNDGNVYKKDSDSRRGERTFESLPPSHTILVSVFNFLQHRVISLSNSSDAY
jgi:hypothetical protein